ncbi:MAG TPA: hypothetical protein ENI27_05390 [bacterium]|nr:hypothetical protein [bacterium]
MKRNISPVVIGSGIALGGLMILSVCWVYIKNQQFGFAGGVLTVFGVLLIGLSVWRTVNISISLKEGIKASFDQMERSVKEVVHQVRELESHLLTNISALEEMQPDKIANLRQREKVDLLRKHGKYLEALEIDPDDVLSMMGLIEGKAEESKYSDILEIFLRLKISNRSGVGYSVYPQVILAHAQVGNVKKAMAILAELDHTITEHVSNGYGYLARAEQLSWLHRTLAEVKAKIDDGAVARAVETLLEKIDATVRNLKKI